jgi:hypothetical protein
MWIVGENDAEHKGICRVSLNGFCSKNNSTLIPQFVRQHISCFENENSCWIFEGEFIPISSRIWGWVGNCIIKGFTLDFNLLKTLKNCCDYGLRNVINTE